MRAMLTDTLDSSRSVYRPRPGIDVELSKFRNGGLKRQADFDESLQD